MKLDLSKCSDEDLEGMILDLQQTLAHRKQVAKRQFREENPILGFSLRNDSAWKYFYEDVSELITEEESLETVKDGFRAFPVRNPELEALLKEGDIIFFDPSKNTKSGEAHPLADKY